MNTEQGIFYGVGVGPGDPELMTLKAHRLIQQADVISYITNEQGDSQAKKIACGAVNPASISLPVVMPMCNDRTVANAIYDEASVAIQLQLTRGKNVVFICEGDPLFFGSFAYLLERLQGSNPCQVVPGISSVHAASSALQQPLTMLKESFAVISGRHSDEKILAALAAHQSVVIMKAGSARSRLLRLLKQAERLDDAQYLEYIGREQQNIVNDVRDLDCQSGPYFSLFVITAKERDRT